MTKTRLTLKPGQPGTKKLMEQFGAALVCVRFKYDREKRERVKTVELIIERTAWAPPEPAYPAEKIVPLHIEGYQLEERAAAKAAGAKWNPEKKLWYVRYGDIIGSELEKHIHVDEMDK